MQLGFSAYVLSDELEFVLLVGAGEGYRNEAKTIRFQAVDVIKAADRIAPPSRALYRKVRAIVAPVVEDRAFSGEVNQLTEALKADASFDFR